jgi:hypothetical protein
VTLTAAQIQVEHRLAHHQYFGAFATKRIAAFVVLLLFWSLCSIWTLKSHAQTQVYFFSVGSLFLALVGLLLSAIAESGGEFGDMAFRLLRLYWFRLADFAVPSVIVLTLATLLSRAEVWKGTRGRIIGFSFGILILAMCLAIYERHRDARPRADQASLWSFSEERKTNDVYRNWRAVCEWIKTNTPNDAVFITPADQQTFKWYAHRAEVVSWKDMPQDAQSIVEWWNRVKQVLQPQRNYDGGLMAYTDADLLALGQYYRADYLLIPQRDLERRQSGTELRQLYPTDPTRRVTYVVLEIPKVPLK